MVYIHKGARGLIVNVAENRPSNQSSNAGKAVYISHTVYTLGKGMHSTIPPPANNRVDFDFNLDMVTGQGEENL